jgi:hypothetical protein
MRLSAGDTITGLLRHRRDRAAVPDRHSVTANGDNGGSVTRGAGGGVGGVGIDTAGVQRAGGLGGYGHYIGGAPRRANGGAGGTAGNGGSGGSGKAWDRGTGEGGGGAGTAAANGGTGGPGGAPAGGGGVAAAHGTTQRRALVATADAERFGLSDELTRKATG